MQRHNYNQNYDSQIKINIIEREKYSCGSFGDA